MKTTAIIPALALVAIASAQESGERGQRPPPPVPPILAFFDADHDGVLSAAEIHAAAEALGRLDKNGDGEITKDELRPPQDKPHGPPPEKRPVPPIITALDADKDGTISAEELEGAPESLKELDKNNDGELSPEELHPHGPPPPPPGEGRRPQGPPPGEIE